MAPPAPSCVRKRVRFVEEDEAGEAAAQDQVQPPPANKRARTSLIGHVPRASEMSEAEKSHLWVRPQDREVIRQDANLEAQKCRKCDNKMILRGQSHFCFRETYANVYAVCNLSTQENQDVCTVVSPEILAFMATAHSGRGLEDRTAPRVAVERRLLRYQVIKSTIQLYHQLLKDKLTTGGLVESSLTEADDERVAHVARTLSRPSRKFGEALGLVDATAAIMIYTDDSNNANNPGMHKNDSSSSVASSDIITDTTTTQQQRQQPPTLFALAS